MVSLRLETSARQEAAGRASFVPRAERPRLILKDLTEDAPAAPTARPGTRRTIFQSFETLLLAAAALSVFLFLVASTALSLFHSVRQSYAGPQGPAVVVISKTVARGDTLSRFAKRYGDPAIYLPAREDQIARANHLSGSVPLVPGQHLRIPVTNPIVLAQIERARRAVASR